MANAPVATKLRLNDVTLAAADCVHPRLAARALEICLDKCDFGDAVLFSDEPIPGRFRSEQVEPIRSLDDYSRFCLREMPLRIKTGFVLVVQWDGYIVDAAVWTNGFLGYDYIGAPGYSDERSRKKPWIVGNGGFSLRSRRLLNALLSIPRVVGLAEDRAICEAFRPSLEREHGIRFAPQRLADRFAYQQGEPKRSTFGFHGLYNLQRVECDAEVKRVVGGLTRRELTEEHFFGLLHHCLNQGRVVLAKELYTLLRREQSAEAVQALMAARSGMPELAVREIGRLETRYKAS